MAEEQISDFARKVALYVDSVLESVKTSRELLKAALLEEAKEAEQSEIKELLGSFGTEYDESISAMQERIFTLITSLDTRLYAELQMYFELDKGDGRLREKLYEIGIKKRKELKEKALEHGEKVWAAMERGLYDIESVTLLGDRDIQFFLRDVDEAVLAKALKIASFEAQHRVLKNMSAKAAKMLVEDMEFMGSIPYAECEKASAECAVIIARLEENGDIHRELQLPGEELV